MHPVISRAALSFGQRVAARRPAYSPSLNSMGGAGSSLDSWPSDRGSVQPRAWDVIFTVFTRVCAGGAVILSISWRFAPSPALTQGQGKPG